MTEDRVVIDREGDILHQLEEMEQGLVLVHRKPPWKPRTNPEDWHGLETTNPEAAYRTIAERALRASNVAIEIGHTPHLRRYGKFITFGWSGSRNAEDTVLIDEIARYDSTLPIGVKNSMDGTIDQALLNIAHITDVRDNNEAPAVLLYREAVTPKLLGHGNTITAAPLSVPADDLSSIPRMVVKWPITLEENTRSQLRVRLLALSM